MSFKLQKSETKCFIEKNRCIYYRGNFLNEKQFIVPFRSTQRYIKSNMFLLHKNYIKRCDEKRTTSVVYFHKQNRFIVVMIDILGICCDHRSDLE